MMTNLFSIFDPSTSNYLSSNWASMLLFMFILPYSVWTINNRSSLITKNLYMYILSEFKPLLNKSPNMLIIILTIFFFIMLNNFMGLMPYVFTATSHLSLSLSLALPMWTALFLYMMIHNMSNTLAHLIPQGTPYILMPFMVIIETISNIIRPMTLAIRLMANMVAGHLLLVLLSNSFIGSSLFMKVLLMAPQLALMSLELAVTFIQAYVFSVLISLYAAEASN